MGLVGARAVRWYVSDEMAPLRLRERRALLGTEGGAVRAASRKKVKFMPHKIPDEVTVAKLSIEAARIALESLFEKMGALPRSEKVMVTDTVREACARLQAAQDVLKQLVELSDSEPPPAPAP